MTNLSLFGTNNAALAQQDAANAYALMQQDASGYIASATIATEPAFTASVPPAATPDAIAAICRQGAELPAAGLGAFDECVEPLDLVDQALLLQEIPRGVGAVDLEALGGAAVFLG